jgi:hypothetical protein
MPTAKKPAKKPTKPKPPKGSWIVIGVTPNGEAVSYAEVQKPGVQLVATRWRRGNFLSRVTGPVFIPLTRTKGKS